MEAQGYNPDEWAIFPYVETQQNTATVIIGYLKIAHYGALTARGKQQQNRLKGIQDKKDEAS